MKKRLIAAFLAFFVAFSGIPLENVRATEAKKQTESKLSSVEAPENYKSNQQKGVQKKAVKALYPEKQVLLIQGNNPWRTTSNEDLLSKLVSYEKKTVAQVKTLDISEYNMIVFANDQAFSTYTAYADIRDKLEAYVKAGGVLIQGACDSGWADGELIEDLPGGVTKKEAMDNYNKIADGSHPIVTGILTDGKVLKESELYCNYCSHIAFNKSSIPADATVILKNTDNEPTLIEYRMGKGTVIASGLTWEFAYEYDDYGTYAKTAFDDLFVYGLYIESGKRLVTPKISYSVANDKVGVFVGDHENRDGIAGAVATINGKSVTADEYGVAQFSLETGTYTVTVTKEGFYKKSKELKLERGKISAVYMAEKGKTDEPYIEEAYLTNKDKIDILTNKIYFVQDEETKVSYDFSSEMAGKKFSKYVLYQGTNIVELTSHKGTIQPGKKFEPEKPIYLRVDSTDGTKSKSYKTGIFIKEKSSGFLGHDKTSSEKYSLGQGVGFKVPEDIPVIGGTEFQYGISDLPVAIEIENNKVKIAIGFTDFKSDEKAWEDYLKKIDEACETAERLDSLKSLCKAYGAKSGGFTLQKGMEKPDFSVAGYIEGVWDGSKIVSVSGKILGGVKFKYSYNQQFIVGPVPVYFEIGGGAEIEISANVTKILLDTGEIQIDVPITFKPFFTIGGGAGINGALSVGAEGEIAVPVTWNISNKYLKVSGTGSMKLKASLLFVFNAEKEIAKGTWVIYEKYYGKSGINMDGTPSGMQTIDLNDYNEYSIIDTDYRSKTSGWRTNKKKAQRSAALTYEEILQSYVLPGTKPQVATAGGNTVMVFQADNGDADVKNMVTLMYSVLGENGWSAPEVVWENNGESDYYAKLGTKGDQIFLVWQKAGNTEIIEDESDDELNSETDIISLAKQMEIAYAEFDTSSGVFENQNYITDNESYDGSAVVAPKSDGTVSVIWVQNETGDILTAGSTSKIMHSVVKDGAVTATETLQSTEQYILSMAAEYVDGSLNIAYSADKDGDLNTADDVELYLYKGGSVRALTDDSIANLNPQIHDGILYWYEGNTIKMYGLSDATTRVVGEGTENYHVLGTDESTEIVFVRSGENGVNTVYSYLVNASEETAVVKQIAEVTGNIDSTSVFKDSDEYYHLIYGLTEYDNSDNFQLVYQKNGNVNDLVLSNVITSESDYVQGEQTATLYLMNQGISDAEGFEISVLEDGDTVKTIHSDEVVKAGEEKELEITFDRSIVSELTEYEFIISNSKDCNTDNNALTVELGYNDVSLSVKEYHLNNDIEVFAEISNLTERETDVEISVYEDSIEGNKVFSRTLTGVTNEQSQIVSFTLDRSQMNVIPGEDKIYMITVAAEEEISTGDNQYILLIPTMKNEVTSVELEDGEETYVLDYSKYEGKTVDLSVKTFPEGVNTELKWSSSDDTVATVNQNGTLTVKGVGETTITVSVDDDTKDNITVRVIKINKTAPKNLKVLNRTAEGVKLEWSALGDVNNYEIYRAESEKGTYKLLGRTDNTRYTDSAVEIGKTYYYKVRGYVNYSGNYLYTYYSGNVSAKVVLEVPTVSAQMNGVKQAYLSWNSIAKADSYEVYRATSKSGTYKLLGTTYNRYYYDNTVEMNKTYYYKVLAKKGDIKGNKSAAVSVKIELSAPGYVSVYDLNYNTVRVYISSMSGVSGYELYRSTSEKGTYKKVSASDYYYIYDTSLTTGKTYYYKARYFYKDGGKTYYSKYSPVTSKTIVLNTPSWEDVRGVGKNQIFLKWKKVAGATGYEIWTTDSYYGTYEKLATVSNTNYLHKKLEESSLHYYRIRAYRTIDGKKYYSSDSYSYSVYTNSTQPYNVKISFDGTNNIITFAKGQDAKGVEISVWNSDAGKYEVLTTTTNTSYKHKKVEPFRTYYYQLRSYWMADGKKVYGNTVSEDYYTTIAKIEDLVVKNVSGRSLKLTWNKVSWADGYEIYRYDNPNGYSEKIATIEKRSTTSYTDKKLKTGNIYTYYVYAYKMKDGYKYTGYSSEYAYGAPKVPTAKVSSKSSYNGITVRWDKVLDASGYEIYRSTKKSGTYSRIKTVTSGSTVSYKDKNVTYGKTYYYKVRAYTTVDSVKKYGYYSGITSNKAIVAAPSKLTVKLTAYNKVKLSWSKSTGADGYYVYYKKSTASKYSLYKVTQGTTASISKLTANKKYSFKVVPYKLVKKEKVKSTKYITKNIRTLRNLKAPKKLTVKATGKTKIKVTWNKVSYAKGYYVYYKKSSAKSYKNCKITTGRSITISGLSKNTKYNVKVIPYGISDSAKVKDDSYSVKSVTTRK